MSSQPPTRLSDATVSRLPVYLRSLTAIATHGSVRISSEELAAASGVSSAQLRKDLSQLGSYGVRGVGYDIASLTLEISRALGVERDWPIVIVGLGNLGRALAAYTGFAHGGFRVVALVDHDPTVVGETIAGLVVSPVKDLAAVVASEEPVIGVITTPVAAAQQICDELVAAGVTSILTFASVPLAVPAHVDVRQVDLATELQLLAVHRLALDPVEVDE